MRPVECPNCGSTAAEWKAYVAGLKTRLNRAQNQVERLQAKVEEMKAEQVSLTARARRAESVLSTLKRYWIEYRDE